MYLLDTDTLVHFLRGNADVKENFLKHRNQPKAISVVSYGELLYGARRSARPQENLAKVYRLAELYPVIDVSRAVMECFGEMKAGLNSKGICVDDFDLLIGCTALTLNYTVVTSNTKHFKKITELRLDKWSA